jgi:hypothetical protein
VAEWKRRCEWRSEAGRRDDEHGMQSDRMEYAADLQARPAQRPLQPLPQHGLPCPYVASCGLPAAPSKQSALDLPEGATRILIIASPWRRYILRAWHPELMSANERE